MKTVLIVDDHPLIRAGVRQSLEMEPGFKVTGEARDGEEALKLAQSHPYDIVILDLTLPRIHGLEVLEKLKILKPNLPVLVLSLHSEEEYAIRVFKSGASGFLTKDSDPALLIDAVKQITAGGKFITPTVAEQLLIRLEGRGAGTHETLSNREFQILVLLGQGKGPKEIAVTLDINPKTVSSYRMRIFEKMQFKTVADVVRYCLENNLSPGSSSQGENP